MELTPIDSGLDGLRIQELSYAMLKHIRANFQLGPLSRDRVYEALNALAFCAASVVQGTGDKEAALDFFQRAFNIQIADLENNPPKRKK
jgi:hypothetical protein